MLTFNHFNFNVLDMARSLAFYKEALNLTPQREKRAADGSYHIVFLQDEAGSPFALELTELRIYRTMLHEEHSYNYGKSILILLSYSYLLLARLLEIYIGLSHL